MPLGVLTSTDLTVLNIVEEKKAVLRHLQAGKTLDLLPFRTKLVAQVGLDSSCPVSWNRLAVTALHLDFADGVNLRHAVIPRQHPEVFGPPPDLRKARQMHIDGGLWGSVWMQVRLSQLCAAALMPQVRPRPPFFQHMTCTATSFAWSLRGSEKTVEVTVPRVYRGVQGLVRLQVGHLAVLWRTGQQQQQQQQHQQQQQRAQQGCRCTAFGRVSSITQPESMKRKTQLCYRHLQGEVCPRQRDCWYAHGEEELVEERAKVTVTLSASSARALPRWAEGPPGRLEIDFAVISSHDQLSLQGISRVSQAARSHQQQGHSTLLRRLVFLASCRNGGDTRGNTAEQVGAQPAPVTPVAPVAPVGASRAAAAAAGLHPLNTFQQRALDLTLKETLAYVQGPPGTGKSTTAAHLICNLLAAHPPVSGAAGSKRPNILVCAPSNKACDRLLRLVANSSVGPSRSLLRVYAKSIERCYWPDPAVQGFQRDFHIAPDLQQFALHEQLSLRDPVLYRTCQDLCAKLEACATGAGSGDNAKASSSVAQRLELNDELNTARDAKQASSRSLVHGADVIFTTCDCASKDRLFRVNGQHVSFPCLVVDEAAQAVEFELAMCCLLADDHIALFGDHLQLGSVITEHTIFPAFRNMATTSLFERVVSKKRSGGNSHQAPNWRAAIPHVTLRRQYRMHPSISCFPNAEFYGGGLVDSPETFRDGFALPSSSGSRLAVIDARGPHGRRSVAPEGDTALDAEASLCNPTEAAVVRDYFAWLLRRGVQAADIAVITPYRAQAVVIQDLIKEITEEMPTIGTVHLLQGEEREYVLLSLVRSFACADCEIFDHVPPQLLGRRGAQSRAAHSFAVGFLKDRRLANVALTRAQLGLVVVGNAQVLSSVPHWHWLFLHARQCDAMWTFDAAKDALNRDIEASDSDITPLRGAEGWDRSPNASGSESEGCGFPDEEDLGECDDCDGGDAFDDTLPTSSSDGESVAPTPLAAAPKAAHRKRARHAKKPATRQLCHPAQSRNPLDDEVDFIRKLSQTTSGSCDSGADLLVGFMSLDYWKSQPPPPYVKHGLRSRSFFTALFFVLAFGTVSQVAYASGISSERFPAHAMSIAATSGPNSTEISLACAVPLQEVMARWARVETAWRGVLQ
ncbi:unnamed protein product, partial [Polarella glacialis]